MVTALYQEFPFSFSNKQWVWSSYDPHFAQHLTTQGLCPIVARIIAGRLTIQDDIHRFLHPRLKDSLPSPCVLPDWDTAEKTISRAIIEGTPLAIWGDYDVDGMSSCALWVEFLRSIQAPDPHVVIPDRQQDGYGLNISGIEKLAKLTKLLITVDCGTTSYEPLARAQELGMTVVVIDHHGVKTPLPACAALVNPHRPDYTGPASLRDLCAAALTFLVIVGVNRALREQGFYTKRSEPSLMSLLDKVALASVCDVMPLRGLNRVFVRQGLNMMHRQLHTGFAALCESARIYSPLSCYHLGFSLGPRLNAGGRIGSSRLGFELLTAQDPLRAQDLAQQLEELNAQRQHMEAKILAQAQDMAQQQIESGRQGIIVQDRGWHMGIVGIVAGRLKDQFYRPVCVMSQDSSGLLKGSARSVQGFDIGAFLQNCVEKDLLITGGGHAMAGGFSLHIDQLPNFSEIFFSATQQWCTHTTPVQKIVLDSALSFGALNRGLQESVFQLAPFGMGNPAPRFLATGLTLKSMMTMGQNHYRLTLEQQGISATGLLFQAKGTPLESHLKQMLELHTAQRPLLNAVVTLKEDASASRYNRIPNVVVEDLGM